MIEHFDGEYVDEKQLVYEFKYTCEHCGEEFTYGPAPSSDAAIVAEMPLEIDCPNCWKTLTLLVHKDGTATSVKKDS